MPETTLNRSMVEPSPHFLVRLRTIFMELSNVQRSLLLAAFFAVVYLSTHSGTYVPNSDGTFYLCVARNLYEGRGFTFNGQAIGNIPPGWPFLLAGAMHISRSFFFLGLIPVVCLSAAVAIWYLVICRTTDSTKAFVGMLICGLLHTWYVSAQNYFSEAPFLLCLGAAVLVAQQIAAGSSLVTRLPLLVLLTAATVCFRWIGIASWTLIAAAVMGGTLEFRLNRRWISVLVILVTVFGTFRLCARYVANPAHVTAYYQSASENASVASTNRSTATVKDATEKFPNKTKESIPFPKLQQNMPMTRPVVVSETGKAMLLPSRFLLAGEWMSRLLCAPAEVGRASSLISKFSNTIGWMLWLCFVTWAIHRAKQGDWLWLGAILFCTAVILRWGHVVQRYMLPATPLLVIGIWNGIEIICNKFPRLNKSFLVHGLLAAILIINSMLLVTDICIARSERFGEKFFAGYSVKLVQASEYLRQKDVSPGEVAVSSRYVNLNLDRLNTYAERQLNLLIGRPTRRVPAEICKAVPDKKLMKWAKHNKVHYYLYRTPVSPWRVWHFRMPTLQAWITGKEVKEQPDWILYELGDEKATRVTLPVMVAWPTVVPETVFR